MSVVDRRVRSDLSKGVSIATGARWNAFFAALARGRYKNT